MIKNYLYTTITACAIALGATPLQANASYSQNVSTQESTGTNTDTTFVCATDIATPTMFAYTPGKVKLTPIMSWYQEYLLPEQSAKEICQQTATKLQTLSQEKQRRFLSTEARKGHNVVCMLAAENKTCNSEDSVELFAVNSNYDPNCILDNREPLECAAIGKVRGVYSVTNEPYTPTWWFW